MAKNTKKKKKLKPWRKAVKEAMYKASKAEAHKRYNSKTPTFNYRWEHVTAVVTLARKLAKLTGADVDIVEAAAWLHDVRKDAKDQHPIEGAKFARSFLPKTDFPSKKIENVAQVIEDHMGLWRDTPLTYLESQILWDADKLAKMGLTAAMHWTGNILVRGKKSYTTTDLVAFGRNADWQKKTVASMHTKPAQQAAKKRLKTYNKIWDKLEAELAGDDLEI